MIPDLLLILLLILAACVTSYICGRMDGDGRPMNHRRHSLAGQLNIHRRAIKGRRWR